MNFDVEKEKLLDNVIKRGLVILTRMIEELQLAEEISWVVAGDVALQALLV